MKTYIIDTNAILRFILEDIPEQNLKVTKVLEKAEKHQVKVILPTQVIFEVEYVLDSVYKVSVTERYEILEELISTKYINLESENYRNHLISSIEISQFQNISLVDALLVILSKLNNAEILTFDKKILQQI